jgi:hypothetical protein
MEWIKRHSRIQAKSVIKGSNNYEYKSGLLWFVNFSNSGRWTKSKIQAFPISRIIFFFNFSSSEENFSLLRYNAVNMSTSFWFQELQYLWMQQTEV